MPELPEVETIRRSLQKEIVGRTIQSIKINKPKQFKGNVDDVIGKKILSVNRVAKMLLFNLDGGLSLLIHLKMSGQLVWSNSDADSVVFGSSIPFAGGNRLPGKVTHIIIKTDGGILFFNDLRQFGWIRVVKDNDPEIRKLMEKLGPEPLSKDFTVDYLKTIFSKSAKPIKLILLDQEKISGIGNIYANDALFEAGILPTRPARSLNINEIEKLQKGIIRVLEDGIKYGGSSAGDEAYVQPDGSKGDYQEQARVYQRDGQKCLRCGEIILRIKQGGRGSFYCPKCQF